MQIPVLIEPVAGNGYRARGMEPFALTADGSTSQEAYDNFKKLLEKKMASGAVVVPLELAATMHPLAKYAGMLKNDPMLEDWKKAMAEYRRKIDEAQDGP